MPQKSALVLCTLVAWACATTVPGPVSAPSGAPASINETETGGFIRLNEESSAMSALIKAPAERVWALLPEIYETLGITAEVRDKDAQTFGTRSFTQGRLDGRRTAEFVRCGNQGAGPSTGGMYRTRLSILSTLKAAPDGGTLISTEVGGAATAVEGTSTGAVRCVSTGTLEQRIRALLTQRLTS